MKHSTLLIFFLFLNSLNAQNLKEERNKMLVNKILYKEFVFEQTEDYDSLENRLGYKLNCLKSVLFTAAFFEESKLTKVDDYNLIIERSKALGEKFKEKNNHIYIISKDHYHFLPIYFGDNKYDYFISDDSFKNYKNKYYDEVVIYIEEHSRFKK